MRVLTVMLLLTTVLPVQAEIFKCTVNGKTQFSDQPCSDKAEIIELKVYQPKNEEVAKQEQVTQQFKEETRVSDIKSLRAENENLKTEISKLERQRDAELEALRERTYQLDDGSVATREHGLFDKMNEVIVGYQQKIRQIETQIQQNDDAMSQLHQRVPDGN